MADTTSARIQADTDLQVTRPGRALDSRRPRVERLQSVNHRQGGARGIHMMLGIVEGRSEEHTSELQSLMRISYAVFCLKKTIYSNQNQTQHIIINTVQPIITTY